MARFPTGQSKKGYPHRIDSNPNKPEGKGGEPNKLPMIADSDPAGNKITTNYPMKEQGNPNTGGGSRSKAVEGQFARGYIHDPAKFGVGNVENGNARRGSPPTVREISGPSD